MTETKVDAVLNFARNVFVDSALKVTSPLIVIVFFIFLFVLSVQDHLGYFQSKSLGIINASPTSKNLVHPSRWHKAWFGLYWISESLALSPHQTWTLSQMHNFLSILKYSSDMGLLTNAGPPPWHPAKTALRVCSWKLWMDQIPSLSPVLVSMSLCRNYAARQARCARKEELSLASLAFGATWQRGFTNLSF